jgi:hypothetical protein
MSILTLDAPVAHVDDARSVSEVIEALREIHGPSYDFAVGRWEGETRFRARAGRVTHRFIIEAEGAGVCLRRGDLVRGPASGGPYRPLDGAWAEATGDLVEAVWPGDALAADERTEEVLCGRGVYFEVGTEATAYRTPRLAMLRHLSDRPGGCAAYPGAFRREALPPERPEASAEDRRGTNRVNEHTLDMRFDRTPPPTRHYHGPVACGGGRVVNHSETAVLLRRSAYGLPDVSGREEGHAVIYRRPAEDPSDTFVVPVRPGSIVVSPATEGGVVGHCFENAFAMLVAIPGFVAPSTFIKE